jgi:hypothetical protein
VVPHDPTPSTLEYARPSEAPQRRLSRVALMAPIIALLATPLTALAVSKIVHHYQAQYDPQAGDGYPNKSSFQYKDVLTVAFGFPVLALARVYLDRSVRGVGLAWLGVFISVFAWGSLWLLYEMGKAVSAVGGAGH